jgi:hypothetical protein
MILGALNYGAPSQAPLWVMSAYQGMSAPAAAYPESGQRDPFRTIAQVM